MEDGLVRLLVFCYDGCSKKKKRKNKNPPTVTQRLLSVTDLLRGRQYLLVALDTTDSDFLGAALLATHGGGGH